MSTRFPLRPLTIFVSGVVVVALAGCQPAPVSVTPVAIELTDSSWPVADHTIDPDLVAGAAHSVVSRYLATTDTITAEGGEGPGKMAGLTTPAWFPTEEEAFSHYRSEGLRTIGDTVFDSLVVQSVSESVTGELHVDVFVCVDATRVWLLPQDAPDPPEGLVEWLRWGDSDMEVSDDEFETWSDYVDTFQPVSGEREAIVFWLVGKDPGSLLIDGTINWEGADPCHTTAID